MAKEKFKYRAPDPSKVKEHSEQSGGSFDSILKQGFDMYRPKNGENTIRILPPTFKDFEYWGLEIWVHNRIGSDESSYLCLNKMRGKDCPICEAAEETSKAGEKEEARALKANKRFLMWLIDRDEKKPMPLAYSMSWSMDRDITALVHNNKSGKILLIDHPDDGMDVTFMKSGTGLKTKYYGYQIERETSPISDNERRQDEILAYVKENPLDEILNFYSADYLAKVLDGKAEKKDELDEDGEDKPRKKKRERGSDDVDDENEDPPKKRKARHEDDDDYDPASGPKRRKPADDEEEEDAPRPRKRDAEDNDEEAEAKPSRRRARDEDAEEDEPPKKKKKVADDDEEEAPKKRRREPDEDEEEEKGAKRRHQYADDEDEDEPPKKKKKPADDDEEEEPRSKRRKPADDEDEEDDKPAKRVRAK